MSRLVWAVSQSSVNSADVGAGWERRWSQRWSQHGHRRSRRRKKGHSSNRRSQRCCVTRHERGTPEVHICMMNRGLSLTLQTDYTNEHSLLHTHSAYSSSQTVQFNGHISSRVCERWARDFLLTLQSSWFSHLWSWPGWLDPYAAMSTFQGSGHSIHTLLIAVIFYFMNSALSLCKMLKIQGMN